MPRKKKDDISLEELLTVRVHFGHRARRWNPRMKKYIYTKQAGIHIFDLVLTRKCLRKAREFLKETVDKGSKILFLSTKMQAQRVVKKWAQKSNSFYLVERWPGGLLTNFSEVQRGLSKLRRMKELKETPKWKELTTRGQYQILREIKRREKLFGGIEGMEKPPGALFIVDPKREQKAVREAIKMKIPVVALLDTDANPDEIDYPIPANDDASRAIDLVLGLAVAELVDEREIIKLRQSIAEKPDETTEKSSQEISKKAPVKEKKDEADDLIKNSPLPKRTRDALIKAGYKKLSEVKKLSKEELMEIKGVGEKAAGEIVKVLRGA